MIRSLLQYIVLATLLQFITCATLSRSNSPDQLVRRADSRDVYVLADTRPWTHITFDDGTDGFFVHSSIWYGGTATDGPIKVEISINTDVAPLIPDGGLHLRILELPASESGKEPPIRGNRQIFKVGTTEMSNLELFDINKLEGFLTTEFFTDANYRVGVANAANINDCNTLSRYYCQAMNLNPPDELNKLWAGAEKWQGKQGNLNVDISKIGFVPPSSSKPTVINLLPDEGCEGGKMKRAGTCKPKATNGGQKGGTFYDELAANPDYKNNPSDMTDLSTEDTLVKAPSSGMPPSTDTSVTLARSGGKLATLTAIGKQALNALGVAGTIVGAAFVILDFINHNWVGGAIGAVGLVAGIATGALVAGPVGWIVGGAIAALFAILPGLFEDQHPPAKRTDVQGIIQWKMFGDASHTGNEQCQKGTADVPGNPDCEALYGSGTISTVLGLNNFDAIAFVIQFNQGYPMSIKDMAAAFFVKDPKDSNSGNDKIATITCNNQRCTPAGRAGCIGGDPPSECNNPTFAINRDLITLPGINAKASDVYNRVIPNPGGDCKLLAFPGTQNFELYDISITGTPSSIACGLNSDNKESGVSLDPGSGGTGTSGNPSGTGSGSGNTPTPTSTNGQGGAYVPAPPASPFTPLSPKSYTCLTYDGGFLCLPPGTYQKQSGVGFEISSATTLTLPPDFKLITSWSTVPGVRPYIPSRTITNTYTANIDPASGSSDDSKKFDNDMQAIGHNYDSVAKFDIQGPNTGPDPICCLWQNTGLGGNVWCGGLGGDMLTPQWQKQASSAKCFNGANMWIYAESYGDKGGAVIKGQTDALKDVPYGDEGNFDKNVVAVWILKGT